jgi:hypothetical protein
MFRDDREPLRERIAELEAELHEAKQEIARLRDALPENAQAVLERRRQELAEASNEERVAFQKQLQDERDAFARERRFTPAPPETPEQRRAGNAIVVAAFMFVALGAGIILGGLLLARR